MIQTKIKEDRGEYEVYTTNDGYQWFGITPSFPTQKAAESVATAIRRASIPASTFRCTLVIEMSPNDGFNYLPVDVEDSIMAMPGVKLIEWHDEDMIQRDEEEE